jgi:hypothetical protein
MKPSRITLVLLFSVLVLITGASAGAADFGMVLSAEGEYVSEEGEENGDFTGRLTPWFSTALGETGSLYLSGKITFEYDQEGETWVWPQLIELERTEFSFRPAEAWYLSLGRQRYRDDGGMIASGLFDGLSASAALGRVRLFMGALYTGLLYKETAEILMTATDLDRYSTPLDYDDPDTYFAPRRILIPLGLEFPDLSPRTTLSLNGIGQFDLNASEDTLNTQYLETRLGFEASDALRFALTAIGALAEPEGSDMQSHFAAALGADWDVPGDLADMLSGELRWGSGAINKSVGPFTPVSDINQGKVFSAALSGLMKARLSYTARPHRSVSLSGEASGFWRTDVETFQDLELDQTSKDRFLGVEACAQAQWAPQSALRFSAGGGVFIPGAAFVSGTKPRWKINAGLILSL